MKKGIVLEGVQMASFTGYKMMGVNAYSKHKDWALKLADWFTNEENQMLRLEERDQGPSNKNAAASPNSFASTSCPFLLLFPHRLMLPSGAFLQSQNRRK